MDERQPRKPPLSAIPLLRGLNRTLNVAGLALFVAVVAAIVLGLAAVLPGMQRDQQPAALRTEVSYAVVSLDNMNMRSEVVAFNRATGAVLKRIPADHQPDVLLTPTRDRLFLLDTRWSTVSSTPTHTLSLLDTGSWSTLASTTIRDRFLYPIAGASTLTLSPDGTRLFVYSYKVLGDDKSEDWLSIVEPASLEVLPTRIPLPGCGGARFSTANSELVVLCGNSNDVRFIDPGAAKVVATVALPHVPQYSVIGLPIGLEVAKDGRMVYVVTNDLRIIEINPNTHTRTREVTTWRQEPQTVLGADSVALSADGRQLMVGVLSVPRDTSSSFSVRTFNLPAITAADTIQLPGGYSRLTATPEGGFFAVPWEGATVQVREPAATRLTPLLQLRGPVRRLLP